MDLIKKLLGIVVLGLLLSGNAYSKDGSGDLRFTSQSFNNFLAYLRGDGSDNWWRYDVEWNANWFCN